MSTVKYSFLISDVHLHEYWRSRFLKAFVKLKRLCFFLFIVESYFLKIRCWNSALIVFCHFMVLFALHLCEIAMHVLGKVFPKSNISFHSKRMEDHSMVSKSII